MRRTIRYMMLMPVLIAQALSSCSLIDEPDYADMPVNASLAFSVSGSTKTPTRMDDVVVQEQNEQKNIRYYRGLGEVYMIPFAISGEQITSNDHPSRLLQDPTLIKGAVKTSGIYGGIYLYNIYTLVRGINAFLVYGRPPAYSNDKAVNGSLQVPELVYPDLSSLRFAPDPIYTGTGTPAEAQLLADYLTNIAEATGSNSTWSNTTDPTLKGYFLNFTGQENDGKLLMAGSTANVIAHVNALYSTIVKLTDDADGLKENIVTRITSPSLSGLFLTSTGAGDTWKLTGIKKGTTQESAVEVKYPASEGLPDGAAVLQWGVKDDKYQFVPQTQTTTTACINNISRYCYPPELIYYVNSRINTSNEEVSASDYTSETDWNNLLNNRYKNEDAMVTGNTQAVAIRQPLQYAVGRLKMSMQAETETSTETSTPTLSDAADKSVPLSPESFPLTGAIICNQHPVGFDFKPVLKSGAASHAEDCFIYDDLANEKSCYLTTEPQDIPSTLVLQTYDTGEGENKTDAEEVIIILEFCNNSGQKFKGKDGVIYEGTKFYLIGKITPQKKDNPEDYEKRVFTQDYVTSVSTKVKTLANAYNVLPDLLGGRLQLGVELTTKWIQAETTNVILQ